MADTKQDIINRLQKKILQWQGFAPPAAAEARGVGLGVIEDAFPNGVFPKGAIHEMLCPVPEQAAAASGFMAGILSRLMDQGGVCIWISTCRKLFPSGLINFNVEGHQLIFIDLQREKDVLWAMEEALKCEGLAAVVAEVRDISFAQSRRLQLAVESSKVTGFLLRNDTRKLSTTTCVARWQISPVPSQTEDGLPGVGYPRWQVDLLRVRNGTPGSWQLEWVDGRFIHVKEHMVEKLIIERRVNEDWQFNQQRLVG